MTGARRGFTLVEVAMATLVMALLAYGTYGASHSVARAFTKNDLTLDRVAEVSLGAEHLAAEVRDARDVVYPPVGAVAPLLVIRNFDGELVSWHYSPAERTLKRAVATIGGVPAPDAQPAARDLDGVQFGQPERGLVAYALFAGDATVLSAAARRNQ